MATARTTTRPKSGTSARAKAGTGPKASAQVKAEAPREGAARVKVEAKVPKSEVRKPLYAYVGAADLAVEKLLTLPISTTAEVKRFSDKVSMLPAKMPNQVGSAVRSLPGAVTAQLSELQGKAAQIYNEFANRGEQRVASIRRSPATEEAVARTRTAVRQTRAARTSARKAVDAAGRVVTEAASPR